jgi:hypothetical protein
MIFLALTRKGVESYQALGSGATGALWLGAGILSEKELVSLRASGVDASDFNYTIELHDSEALACAIETIKEHHPGQPLWVEA